jgi:hypothetical protein
MPDFDSSQYPIIYRAISKRGALPFPAGTPWMAFLRRPNEEGLSVLLSVNCSAGNCEANKSLDLKKCYGEYALSSEKVEELGLTIKLDSPDAPDYSNNHAEIIGLPIHDPDAENDDERLAAQTWATRLVDTKPSHRLANPIFKAT